MRAWVKLLHATVTYMGNCMKKQPAIQSDDDIWGSPVTSPRLKTVTTEVKIKISKKQLEELLGRTDVQGLTVEQVLAQLMDASDGFESHQRSWRPALQSIPE
ncbi:hypothetical protein L1987_55677 [Smallanthus sonchifolius]|uniref:Uncharacterized protein n=1 Tax=Smallanthus sonchifolius TaxID=185202 RepID=A0ACB9EBA1_9ASTR|nr:hypothetical protein L1987_55677 [Smallanthus sonchifolius]